MRHVYLVFLCLSICRFATAGTLLLPKTALEPHEVALIINEANPMSRRVGDYYQQRRGIPSENVIRVWFENQPTLHIAEFKRVFDEVVKKTPRHVQTYALAWARPYRVGCQSITTAFATGYDLHYCGEKLKDQPCSVTGSSPYAGSDSRQPKDDFGLRPAMLLAAETFDDAKRLIDRGIAADASFPVGTAYLLSTSDKARSVRRQGFAQIKAVLGAHIDIQILQQNDLTDRDDVLFYFTGKARVDYLDTLTFLPGAVGDHLTSGGGVMTAKKQGGQMSAMRWLEAGATGSYGTVIEPCNFPQKFPNPGVLMRRYLKGASLIEAYWKSVGWPGEGVFIGEPLAAPFSRRLLKFNGSYAIVPAEVLAPGTYRLELAESPVGPYLVDGRLVTVTREDQAIRISGLTAPYVRLIANR